MLQETVYRYCFNYAYYSWETKLTSFSKDQ